MAITNINIEEIIAHEVIRRSELNTRKPMHSENLINIDDNAKRLIGSRIMDVINPGSHCVDLTVDGSSLRQGSSFDIITKMLNYDDRAFIGASKGLADSLSNAQTAGSIKDGLAIFIKGNDLSNATTSRFIVIIKADPDKGLSQTHSNNTITLEYVSNILLGESSRLIKVAIFIENNLIEQPLSNGQIRDPEDFSIKVFDHLMQNSTNGNASLYFYGTFLGCSIAENAAIKTQRFFNITRDFINEMDIEQNQKVEYYYDLISYIRGNETVINPTAFARAVLPENQQDKFIRTCEGLDLRGSFSKNNNMIKNKLRRQSLKFSSDVTIIASPDTLNNSVQILRTETIDDEDWTILKIKGKTESIK